MTPSDKATGEQILWKDRRHDHFWIGDGHLYESYRTIRGLRYRGPIADAGQEPDHEKISDAELEQLGFTVRSLLDL